jgi:hypothetical protein
MQLARVPHYITSGWPQQKTPFPSNPFIVAYVFVAVGTCLPSRCLAMNVYSASCHNISVYSFEVNYQSVVK